MTRFVPAAIIALSFVALAFVGRAVDDHLAERESNKMSSELDHLPPSEIRERIEAVEELRKKHPGRVPLGPTDQSEFARQWRSRYWVTAANHAHPDPEDDPQPEEDHPQ